ncbi:gamma-glutamyltransferase family protein [Xanthobacter sp. TB0136]|uniref:gamma-glutamyltransferase family protein n=1 Tax=Xanthobacter sp. TB0136 TaxID=3459177 RepID=UPI0040399AFC
MTFPPASEAILHHESVHAGRGMVAAPHILAAQAGRDVLAEGGNAVEAAIAAAATIAVVYPHMNHLGGDGFWLIREPSGKVHHIAAAGFAGARATIAHYRDQGLESIPARGPLSALTVPGAVGGWALALEAARANGGRMSLPRLLEAAIHHARTGSPVSRSFSRLARENLAALSPSPGFRETFLRKDEADQEWTVPQPGEILRQNRLADTLEHLARTGLQDFYSGDIGREIARDLEQIGSPVTRADLERYKAVRRAPLQVQLKVGTAYNAPPPTQGIASLIILALFERLGVQQAESFAHVHGLVEATKQAFMVRDKVVLDPEHAPVDLAPYLTPEALDRMAARIDPERALPWPQPARPGDTIWLGAADSSGLMVSYIQSIYFEFGSGCVLPGTGVLMQNRGVSFSLDEKSIHALRPGWVPFHTLNPALAQLNDGRIIAYGTMGGEGQPQSQSAVFSRHVMFGMPLGQSIARPRWLLGRTWGDETFALRLESGFEESVLEGLRRSGQPMQVLEETWSDTMGHAGAVVLHPDNTLEGAHDPRADGGAAGV